VAVAGGDAITNYRLISTRGTSPEREHVIVSVLLLGISGHEGEVKKGSTSGGGEGEKEKNRLDEACFSLESVTEEGEPKDHVAFPKTEGGTGGENKVNVI